MTKRRREAETAAATAAMADAPDTRGVRRRRAALEGTINSVTRNAQRAEAAGLEACAARRWQLVAEYRERLEALS
jgi:hypothetical protein